MRLRTPRLLAAVLASSVTASATTIPPDLEARANALGSAASPAVRAFAKEEGAALAKASGPVDVVALEQKVRTRFGVPPAGSQRGAADPSKPSFAVLGSLNAADVEAVCFLVLMLAAKSAQEDLKAIMAHVKANNDAKAQQRSIVSTTEKSAPVLAPTATPTPRPDRVSLLVSAARGVSGRLGSADLSRVVPRR